MKEYDERLTMKQGIKKRTTQENKEIEALERISSSSYMVVLGNPLLNARYDLTAFQMKIFHFLVLNTDQTSSGFKVTKVKVSEVSQFLKTKTSDYLYNLLEKESRKLMKKEIFLEDERGWKVANILAQIEYHKKEGAFSFLFPPMLDAYLLQLKKNFTYIDVRNIVSMDSVYAIRFYGFCKEFERFGKFQFTVEEMRRMFNLENKYELYGLFKQKVVVKAQDELIKNSDLIFDFNEIKEGKKVVAMQFVIRKNPNKTQAQLEVETNPTSQEAEDSNYEVVESNTQPNFESSTLQRLSGIVQVWGIDSSTLQNWLEQYPIEQVILGVEYVQTELEKEPKKIKNIPAYLKTIVSSSQLVERQKAVEEEKRVLKAVLKKSENEKLQLEQLKQQQDDFLHEVYKQKKKLVLESLQQNHQLYQRVLNSLNTSAFSAIYYDSFVSKVGTEISLDSFLAYFNENTGFEAIVITTLEHYHDLNLFEGLVKHYGAQAKALGLNYF